MSSSRISGVNENISTYGGSGLGRDYTAMSTWEAATDIDLVTAEVSEVLFICKDAATYDDKVQLAGATTSEDYRRIIRGAYAEDFTGVPNQMVQFTITTTSFAGACFSVQESYAVLQDLSTENRLQTGSNAYGFHVATGAYADVVLVGCLATTTHPTSGIGFFWGSSQTGYIINCLSYSNTNGGYLAGGSGAVYLLNCTAVGNTNYGIQRTSGSCHAINCLADGNATDFVGTGGANSAYNASSDDTAYGTTGARRDQVFAYIDADNDDYHLAEGDTGARGYGGNANTAAVNPSGLLYDDDVDREEVVVWSIGFDSDGSFAPEDEEDCDCPGSFTEVGAANGALAYLGAGLLTTFDTSTKQGALLSQMFAPTRRRLQQGYRWEFCLRRLSFTSADVVDDVPTWGFLYAFLLPSNMLQLWEVNDPHENPRYRMENKHLLINQNECDILYSVEETDSNKWSATFYEALEFKLASRLAMPLLHKPELMRMYEEMFLDKIADAIFLNDIQSDDLSAYSSILSNARLGFNPREITLDLD